MINNSKRKRVSPEENKKPVDHKVKFLKRRQQEKESQDHLEEELRRIIDYK